PHIPMIGMSRDNPKRDPFASASDHQFGVRFLNRLRIQRRIRKLIIASVERTAILRPERTNDLAGLVEALQSFAGAIERKTVGFMFVALPSCPETEQKPSAGNNIELSGHFCHDRRMTIRIAEHDSADSNSGHRRRKCGEGG